MLNLSSYLSFVDHSLILLYNIGNIRKMVSFKTLVKSHRYKYNNHILRYWGHYCDPGKRRMTVFVFFDEKGDCKELSKSEIKQLKII